MPELRKDPVVGRWVIIASERAKRPDQFLPLSSEPSQDTGKDSCPFCEGHESQTPSEIFSIRKTGAPNQPGWETRVIPSKHPILRVEGDLDKKGRGMYDIMNGLGAHEIILEAPGHAANLADLPESQVAKVVRTYMARIHDLEKDKRLRYALLFKNYGAVAGAGPIRHAHSELMAMPVNPARIKDELAGCMQYYSSKERCLYCDIVRQELVDGRRLAVVNEHFVAIAPFASRFPFELWILPRRHSSDFTQMRPEEPAALAHLLKMTLMKLRLALKDPPYNFILHTAPFRRERPGAWNTLSEDFHWHIEIMPRLTRVAGFEWGSGFYINPTPPEEAARFLREIEVAAYV
ncbi:MAG: DUF4921 family protein [Candidatus Omnitrophica bacterium]|nr:DUF4921 family protein [Candidatus Omnitrophota bacterium]